MILKTKQNKREESKESASCLEPKGKKYIYAQRRRPSKYVLHNYVY